VETVDAAFAGVLDEIVERSAPPPPPAEWRTARQLAALWGLSAPHTREQIARGVALGLVEKRVFRVTVDASSGRTYPVPHYRPRPR
jgi:hypothetical protein